MGREVVRLRVSKQKEKDRMRNGAGRNVGDWWRQGGAERERTCEGPAPKGPASDLLGLRSLEDLRVLAAEP